MKEERVYRWAFVGFGMPTEMGFRKGLLVQRSLNDPADRAYYFICAREETSINELVRVAGAR